MIPFPFKKNIELVVGIAHEHMKLELRDEANHFVSSLSDPDATFESLHVCNGMIVHVEDITASAALPLLDTSAVEKYELPEEKYAQRAGGHHCDQR